MLLGLEAQGRKWAFDRQTPGLDRQREASELESPRTEGSAWTSLHFSVECDVLHMKPLRLHPKNG